MEKKKTDEEVLKELRKQIFLTGYAGGMAHLASSFSCLEILYTLYQKGIMTYDPERPDLPERDRLILSKGHAGLALYGVMCLSGFLTWEEYRTYLQPGACIGGEPCMRDLPGVEATTGSLGHGLSMGFGMALAQKLDKMNAKTYVILGDGECEEGTVWEAVTSAAALHLNNLTAILDANNIQKMSSVSDTIGSPDWEKKWTDFGWDVLEADGHDVADLERVLKSPNLYEKPRLIVAHTVKGKGVSLMENDPNWHFRLPNRKQLTAFQKELDISDEEMAQACRERISEN